MRYDTMKREKQTRQKLLALVGALVAALVTAPAQAVKVVPETQPYPPWTIAPYDLSNYDLNLAPGQAFQPTFDHLTHAGNLFGWTLDQYANRVPGWYTTSVYASEELADADYWRNRKIIFLDDSGDQQPFWWDRLPLEQKKLLDDPNSAKLGPWFMDKLNALDFKSIKKVRGRGLFIGMAFVAGAGSIITLLGAARGAVAIADRQTAIYPAESPGGWNLIGRCPVRMFDPDREPTMPVAVGDRVRFEPVDRARFLELGGELS